MPRIAIPVLTALVVVGATAGPALAWHPWFHCCGKHHHRGAAAVPMAAPGTFGAASGFTTFTTGPVVTTGFTTGFATGPVVMSPGFTTGFTTGPVVMAPGFTTGSFVASPGFTTGPVVMSPGFGAGAGAWVYNPTTGTFSPAAGAEMFGPVDVLNLLRRVCGVVGTGGAAGTVDGRTLAATVAGELRTDLNTIKDNTEKILKQCPGTGTAPVTPITPGGPTPGVPNPSTGSGSSAAPLPAATLARYDGLDARLDRIGRPAPASAAAPAANPVTARYDGLDARLDRIGRPAPAVAATPPAAGTVAAAPNR